MKKSVAVIGECMLELTHARSQSADSALPMSMSYGGDTINTAIYLSRNNVAVSYVTGLGDDLMSDWLLEEWAKERIDCSLVVRMPNSVPGMYMINVADDGERSFLYWRKHSPASRIFDDSNNAETLFRAIVAYEYLYLSGISLAILSSEARERLFRLLKFYRLQGGKIIFDGNYRPSLWESDIEAQQAYREIYRITDMALPTLEDEALLFGYESAEEVIDVLQESGVSEAVVKMGGNGCLSLFDDNLSFVETEFIDPVDTTAAGDSFNAGYLAARFEGQSGVAACGAGHALASIVIRHQGAIIPVHDNLN